LLIALSVAGVTSVVSAADRTVPYFAASRTLTPGTVLGEGDVVVVHVAVAGGAYVQAEDAPWGQVVTRTVGSGELVPIRALAEADDFDGRAIAVTTAQPLATGVVPGSFVDVYLTREGPTGEPVTELVVDSLVVESIDEAAGAFASSDAETVYLVVPLAQVETLLDAVATHGEISVVGIAGAHS